MNVEIICIGNLKEAWLKEAEKEYIKRLVPYLKLNVIELNETKLPKNASAAEKRIVINEEGNALLTRAFKSRDAFVYALDMNGKQFSSENFAEQIKELALSGKTSIVFLIGGSLGLHEEVKKKADIVLSFSKFTYPHQMMRIILLEQIYRSQKIARGEPYHK